MISIYVANLIKNLRIFSQALINQYKTFLK